MNTNGKPIARNIECKFGDSTKFDITPYRGKADFIFVDGGQHLREAQP